MYLQSQYLCEKGWRWSEGNVDSPDDPGYANLNGNLFYIDADTKPAAMGRMYMGFQYAHVAPSCRLRQSPHPYNVSAPVECCKSDRRALRTCSYFTPTEIL